MELPFKIDLNDKVAVVTGGGGVLCSKMAEALALCGAKTAVISLHEEKAKKTADEIIKKGGIAIGIGANVLDAESLKRANDIIGSKFGNCDILINGAGGNHPKGNTTNEYLFREDLIDENVKTFFDLEAEGIEYVFNLNFLGTLLASQVFGKSMAEAEGGVIINISSMSAYTPLTKIPAYSGAKAAVSNFTQWLAVHMSKAGIRVNAIAPGFFISEQNHALLMNEDGSMTERGKKIISQTPMGRFGSSHELIGTLLWLVDNKASGFVTGIVVPVDGGFSAYSGV